MIALIIYTTINLACVIKGKYFINVHAQFWLFEI